MCGISAVFGKGLEGGAGIVRASLEAVKHRGTSLFEMAVFDDCALGANRLEIVDRENARQPASNENGTVFAVLNGEIYNHAALRGALEGEGHRFRTASDTEVLVHLYEERGPAMTGMLDSEMFAFFIYDRRSRSFFAARDRFGVKPLYYSRDEPGNLHFASEMKQLSETEGIREIMEFPPAHFMQNGRLARYHEVPGAVSGAADTQEIIRNLRALFDNAVKKRLDTDLPVGVFFSGGVDSGSVLATAMKFREDVTAITLGRPDSPDMLASERYCRENGVRAVRAFAPDESELAGMVPEIVRITESFEPHVIRYAAVGYFIAKLARERGFRIILSGDGSEELFAGYSAFQRCRTGAELSALMRMHVSWLGRTQFQRVDRTSMHHALEVRLPFFDTAFAAFAMGVPPALKLRSEGGRKTEKWVWREAMKDRLPAYVTGREKAALSEGAGFAMGERGGGPLARLAGSEISDDDFRRIRKEYPDWNLATKEAAYYFRFFEAFGYAKASFAKSRPYTKPLRSGFFGALLSRFSS